jgi:anti-sigma B factor antagonist
VHEEVNGDRAGASREDRAEFARRLGDVVPAPTPYARTYRLGHATVVELAGEIDLGSAQGVHPHLDAAALWPLPLLVVFDLGPLEFIDCYGLALLVRARRRVLTRGGRTAMVCVHRPTRKLLGMTGLDAVFCPVLTLDEALRS